MQHVLLVEIGLEELSAKTLRQIAQSFAENMHVEFKKANILYNKIIWFASPRRLAVQAFLLTDCIIYEKFSLNCDIGITQIFCGSSNDSVDKIFENWAKNYKLSAKLGKYFIYHNKKWLLYRSIINNNEVHILLIRIITNALIKITVGQRMRWGTGDLKFFRPIHTITVLFDNQLVRGKIFNIDSDKIIFGHRFMGQSKIELQDSLSYTKTLMNQGYVIVDYNQRKEIIRRKINEVARTSSGYVDINEYLLDEITSLVEWPVVLKGSFDSKFLNIPAELLIHIMQDQQKYFVIYDIAHKIMPFFIFVANIESKYPEKIILGNEKVIVPKLEDAIFLLDIDNRLRLEDYLPILKNVLFFKELGSLFDKIERVELLSAVIAEEIKVNVLHAKRAARLSKCDLVTSVVTEFPKLQGIIGMYYARRDGESELVSLAQKEQYYPRFSRDFLPTTYISCVLAIADRIDTISGMFSIKYYPKGSTDPFALRRSVIGIIRIILEKKLSLNLLNLIKFSVSLYDKNKKCTNLMLVEKITNFIQDKVFILYKDKGYEINLIRLLLPHCLINLLDFDIRIQIIHKFSLTQNAVLLKLVTRRISNILKINRKNVFQNFKVDLLEQEEEINLANQLLKLNVSMDSMFHAHQYQDILIKLTSLIDLVNIFFKKITIMTDNKDIQINRLNLLYCAYKLFTSLVDFSNLKL